MKIERTAVKDKTTPGTYRYQEQIPEGESKTFGSVYLRKDVVDNVGEAPEQIRVILEW